MFAPRFKRPGMCVALMDRRRKSAHSSNIAACLHKPSNGRRPGDYVRDYRRVVGANQYMLAVPVVLAPPSELKGLLPIPIVYVPPDLRLWPLPRSWHPLAHRSPASVEALLWPPRVRSTNPRGTPRLKKFGLRHGARASMRRGWTAILNVPRVHAVQGTRVFSHSCVVACVITRWHTAEADAMSSSSLWNSFKWTSLPSLKWRR